MGTDEDGAAAPNKKGDGGAAGVGAAAAVGQAVGKAVGWDPNEKIAGALFFCSPLAGPSVIVSCDRLFVSIDC